MTIERMTEIIKERRTAADYESLLQEHASSKMTLRAFAQSKGIKPMTFYAWNRRLRPRPGSSIASSGSAFVPVELIADSTAGTRKRGCVTDAELKLDVTVPGRRVISIPPGFDAAALRRLLKVLEEAC